MPSSFTADLGTCSILKELTVSSGWFSDRGRSPSVHVRSAVEILQTLWEVASCSPTGKTSEFLKYLFSFFFSVATEFSKGLSSPLGEGGEKSSTVALF